MDRQQARNELPDAVMVMREAQKLANKTQRPGKWIKDRLAESEAAVDELLAVIEKGNTGQKELF